MDRHFAALDAGANGITVAAARWNRNGDCMLEGVCRAQSKGFRKGMVTDLSMAIDSIVRVFDKLKKKTGKRVQDIYAGVSSGSVAIAHSSGTLLLSKYGREISERDISKCVEIGSIMKMPLNKEPLHRIVRGFSIDGEKEVKNPLNLEGVKLGVNVNVLTISSSVVNNMSRCISQAGFVPAGFVFSGIAAAHRTLTGEDKEEGVALLNIYKNLAEVTVFHQGILTGCKVIPVAMNDILSKGGSIDTGSLKKLVSRIVSLSGWGKVRKVVIAGEEVIIDDLVESLEKMFTVPVIAGTCIVRPFEDLPPERAEYIGSLGILDHLQEENRFRHVSDNVVRRNFSRAMRFLDRYF